MNLHNPGLPVRILSAGTLHVVHPCMCAPCATWLRRAAGILSPPVYSHAHRCTLHAPCTIADVQHLITSSDRMITGAIGMLRARHCLHAAWCGNVV